MMTKDKEKVLAALANAGAAGLTQNQIRRTVFHGHRDKEWLASLLAELTADDLIASVREPSPGGGDRPTLRWREIVKTQNRPESVQLNGHAPPSTVVAPPTEPLPPPGIGWVRWRDVVYITQAGVPRGYALRQGKRVRERRSAKTEQAGNRLLTDELRGIRHVAGDALRKAIARGFIERQGDWARLLRDPVCSQRPWMEAVYTILGRAHPTLTGEWTPKPPKTLVSVKEAALGRRLLSDEFLRRKPGKGGSWDPADIEVRVRMPHTSSVAELEEFLANYHVRVAEAPRIEEPRQFEVNLPQNRRS